MTIIKKKVANSHNNLKQIYRIVTEATDGSLGSVSRSLKIKGRDGTFSKDIDMANYCNEFFTNVGLVMYEKINTPTAPYSPQYSCMASMFLRPVSENELISKINELKTNCSPGNDNVDSKTVKYFHKYLIKPLKHIINMVFKTGDVPSQFKASVVTPVHKSGDRTDISNFRPISVINNFAKIFEKCVKDRLVSFLNSNNIFSRNQFGFTAGLSTADSIYEVVKNITDNLNNGKKCLAVFLDLARAFDTVPHDSLLRVLHSYGVRGTVLNVFENYLTKRQQKVRINGILSDAVEVKIGVPQGTVLGPILFIAYLNSLTDMSIKNGSVISYADDTVIVMNGDSWSLLRESTDAGISKIKNWLDTFKLSLNVDKTKYIAFSLTASNRPDFDDIFVSGLGHIIGEVPYIKYLGVTIDKHLRWDQHILRLTNNIRSLIRKFYILREIMRRSLLTQVYKALVESLIRYGMVAWGGLCKTTMNQLNVAQNYVLKVMYKKSKLCPTHNLYTEDILNVRCLYILCTCIFVYKNNKLKTYVNHSYNTRARDNKHLQIPISNRNINLKFLNYLAPKIYNLVPPNIKDVSDVGKFKRACRLFIVRNVDVFSVLF